MKDKELFLLLLVIGGGLYLLMRNRTNTGGAATYGGGLQPVTNQASTAGGATGIGTNPITLAFSTLERGLTSLLGGARAGNAPATATQPASKPMTGPTIYAGALPPSPPLYPLPTGIAYPTIQDPNQGFLSSLIDINTFTDAYATIPDVSGANQAGQLNVSPDFNWEYSPTSPGIAIVGLEG